MKASEAYKCTVESRKAFDVSAFIADFYRQINSAAKDGLFSTSLVFERGSEELLNRDTIVRQLELDGYLVEEQPPCPDGGCRLCYETYVVRWGPEARK